MSEDFNGISSYGWSQIAWYKRKRSIIWRFQRWISLIKDVLFISRNMVQLNSSKSNILKKSPNSRLPIIFPWIRNAAQNSEKSHGRSRNFIAVSYRFVELNTVRQGKVSPNSAILSSQSAHSSYLKKLVRRKVRSGMSRKCEYIEPLLHNSSRILPSFNPLKLLRRISLNYQTAYLLYNTLQREQNWIYRIPLWERERKIISSILKGYWGLL